jgi:hypothetical protein
MAIKDIIISFIVLIIVSFTIYLIYTNPAYFQKQKNTDNYSQPIIDSTSNLIPINIENQNKIIGVDYTGPYAEYPYAYPYAYPYLYPYSYPYKHRVDYNFPFIGYPNYGGYKRYNYRNRVHGGDNHGSLYRSGHGHGGGGHGHH